MSLIKCLRGNYISKCTYQESNYMNETIKHRWEYCDHCETMIVICGFCGNNCCNGGYGEILDSESSTKIECPHCASAYDLQDKDFDKMNETTKQQLLDAVKSAKDNLTAAEQALF